MAAMNTVLLPKSMEEIRTKHFQNFSIVDTLRIACGYDPSRLTPAQKMVWKYSGRALLAGRPLDSAIIFMAGVSGSGKSSTINTLFEDNHLCKTSSSRSETDHVALVRKLICFNAENPGVQGYLGFVDVPGTFDTDPEKEAKHMTLIRKFKNSRIELADRKGSQLRFTSIRKSVFPNIVLFVINATDERMDGKESELARSLQAFEKTTNLMDREKNNVIVVLTHAMSISRKKKKFIAKLEEKKRIIQEQFRRVLDIVNVEVVPVENKPKDYQDTDSDDSDNSKPIKMEDFYVLPNGEISHLNLFEAMLRRFDANLDLLGRLLISRYFSTVCPEREDKAEVTIYNEESTAFEIAEAARDLSNLQIAEISEIEPITPFYTFQSLGYGYCPVTEEVKLNSPQYVNPGSMIKVDVGFSKFAVPQCVEVFTKKENRFRRLSFLEKSEYQQYKKKKYGLDVDFELIVNTNSEGRWINEGTGKGKSCMLSVVQEMKICNLQIADFRLKDPASLELNPKFTQELHNLPYDYNEKDKDDFRNFFTRWGTHLIVEQAIGGAIQLNCTIDQASLTRQQLNLVEAEIANLFKNLFSGESNKNLGGDTSKLRKIGVTNEHLRIIGGDAPKLGGLETVNSQVLQDWAKTVAENPAQLKSTIKLFPYYKLARGNEQYNSLRQATKEYLCNKLKIVSFAEKPLTRNEIAEKAAEEVLKVDDEKGCFPKGALVSLQNGNQVSIENLNECSEILQTFKIKQMSSLSRKFKVGKLDGAKFCTFLDKIDNKYMEYTILEFDNGKMLAATGDHLIFQYLTEKTGFVIPKRTKCFKVGDQALYLKPNERSFDTPTVIRIHKKNLLGAYCPLTTTGSLILDGFLVSSFSNINSFNIAQAAMLPLKLWCLVDNKSGKHSSSVKTNKAKEITGVHPYAKFLMSLCKK